MPQTLEYSIVKDEAVAKAAKKTSAKDVSEGPSRASSTPVTLAVDAAVSAGAQAKQPVCPKDCGVISLQPQSRRLEVLEELSENYDTTIKHAEGEEGEEGQSSFSRDSPEGQADEGEDDDDEEETEEDTTEVGGVEDSGLISLLGEVLQEINADLPSKHKTAGTEGPLASTKCTHCGEIHGTYAKQCEVAHRLFDKIMAAIKGKDKGSDPKKFKDFELYILVPSLSSLYNQIVNRLNEFVEQIRETKNDVKNHGSFLCGMGGEERVFKSTDGKAENDKHSEMERRIKNEKDTLFLIIHDEAHYEATRNPAKGKRPVDKFINSATVLTSPNVVTLLVSATPYSLVSSNSRIPELNITDWMDDSRQNGGSSAKQDSNGYFGLARYAENTLKIHQKSNPKPTSGYIAADPELEERLKKCYDAGDRPDRKTSSGNKERKAKASDLDILRCDMLTNDYHLAMQLHRSGDCLQNSSCSGRLDTPEPSEHTKAIVRALLSADATNGRGCMVLVRVTTVKLGRDMARRLREGRDHLGLKQKFAVLADVEESTSAAKQTGSKEKSSGKENLSALLKTDSSKKPGATDWVEWLRLSQGKAKIEDLDKDIQQSQLKLKTLKKQLTGRGECEERSENERKCEKEIKELTDKVAQLQKDRTFPETYEDLKDLPVILIVCLKGKMGDTFPKSLRYYDLRMKYANSCEVRAPVEQDLGMYVCMIVFARACMWKREWGWYVNLRTCMWL